MLSSRPTAVRIVSWIMAWPTRSSGDRGWTTIAMLKSSIRQSVSMWPRCIAPSQSTWSVWTGRFWRAKLSIWSSQPGRNFNSSREKPASAARLISARNSSIESISSKLRPNSIASRLPPSTSAERPLLPPGREVPPGRVQRGLGELVARETARDAPEAPSPESISRPTSAGASQSRRHAKTPAGPFRAGQRRRAGARLAPSGRLAAGHPREHRLQPISARCLATCSGLRSGNATWNSSIESIRMMDRRLEIESSGSGTSGSESDRQDAWPEFRWDSAPLRPDPDDFYRLPTTDYHTAVRPVRSP